MGNNRTPDFRIAYNTLPFWSRFIVEIDLRYDGVHCLLNVLRKGSKLDVFNYRQGEANAQALQRGESTERDTILQEAGKTAGGSRYKIIGMSITKDGYPYTTALETQDGHDHYIWPGFSEPPCNQSSGPLTPSVEDQRSLNALMLETMLMAYFIQIKVDGVKRTLEMGIPAFYPGQGGAKDSIESTNGDVFVANYMPIPEGIVWNPSGAVDSNFKVKMEAAYDIWLPTWTTPTGTANGNAETQENPKIPDAIPTALGRKWKQGFFLHFHGQQESPLSNVS